jgi:periplasmic protein TonB
MKNSKKSPMRENQLKLNSFLFLQLGIILSLIIVYSAFDLKFSKKTFNLPYNTILSDEPYVFVFPQFEIEKKSIPKEKTVNKLPKLLTEFEIDKTDDKSPKEVFIINKSQPPIDFDSIFSDVPLIDDLPKDETIPFILVEQSPRYPGCKGPSEDEFKKCFNEKIKKFITKKYNSNLDVNLSGKQKINVQFEIDKNGDIVNIKARAAHKRLEKEAIKVVSKLPKMEPGKQRNTAVGVKYILPISLYFN